MIRYTILVILAVLCLRAAVAHDFSSCGSDGLDISAVDLTPDPPLTGHELTVAITATPTRRITDGQAQLTVSAWGVNLATLDIDLCHDMGVTCPLEPGKQVVAHFSYGIGANFPTGLSATAKVSVKDQNNDEAGCFKIKVKLSKGRRLGEPETSATGYDDSFLTQMWESWKQMYNKAYQSAEEHDRRFSIFTDNTDKMINHNKQEATYSLAHNEYSDLSWTEFRDLKNLGRPIASSVPSLLTSMSPTPTPNTTAPSSIDWVAKGAVTPVKNQGQCGSCWTFSAVEAVEALVFIKTGKLVSLSEEEVVECATAGHGCSGGTMDIAFDWIKQNHGICSEQDYPYSGGSGACHSTKCTNVPGSAITGYTSVQNNEQALLQAVAGQPVSVAIEADQSAFQFYSGGVLTGTCGTKLDHGVLVVGYGEANGTDYWKVKNSWGSSWGEQGYVLLERGKAQSGGQCGILMMASFPTESGAELA